MSLYSVLHRVASDWAAAREAARTERFIGALPAEIRKDIGWPSETGRAYMPAVASPVFNHRP